MAIGPVWFLIIVFADVSCCCILILHPTLIAGPQRNDKMQVHLSSNQHFTARYIDSGSPFLFTIQPLSLQQWDSAITYCAVWHTINVMQSSWWLIQKDLRAWRVNHSLGLIVCLWATCVFSCLYKLYILELSKLFGNCNTSNILWLLNRALCKFLLEG